MAKWWTTASIVEIFIPPSTNLIVFVRQFPLSCAFVCFSSEAKGFYIFYSSEHANTLMGGRSVPFVGLSVCTPVAVIELQLLVLRVTRSVATVEGFIFKC